MYDLFEDLDIYMELVNKAYKSADGLLSDLYINNIVNNEHNHDYANIVEDYMEEITAEMQKHNPFEDAEPARQMIKNLFKATETIIKVVYPNAKVTYKEYPHKTKDGYFVDFDIDVDEQTYRNAVKRMAVDLEIDEELELKRLGLKL